MNAAIVVADFYQDIAEALTASCRAALAAAGAEVSCYTVPGALEIAPAISRLAYKKYDCYIALGCVIRGETYHFEVVANTSASGILQLQLRDGLAVGNGILTVENKEQALARSGKGGEAAAAALALARL